MRIDRPSEKVWKSLPLWMRSWSPSRYGTAAKKSGESSKVPVQQSDTLRDPVTRPCPSPCEHAGAVIVTTSDVMRRASAREAILTALSLADAAAAEHAVAVVEDRYLSAADGADRIGERCDRTRGAA